VLLWSEHRHLHIYLAIQILFLGLRAAARLRRRVTAMRAVATPGGGF
jgi:hypothetical protein